MEKEAQEAERKRKEEEEAREREAREAIERETALARRRKEKAMSLGVEPDKGPDVTRVIMMKKFFALLSSGVLSIISHASVLNILNIRFLVDNQRNIMSN